MTSPRRLEYSVGIENELSTSSIPPVPTLYLGLEECNFKGKINTYCKMAEKCKFIEKCLSDHPDGMAWLMDSQFGPLFDAAHHTDMILMPLWILLSRKVKSPKNSEVWFVLNDIPIRYSLIEHALMCGLNCDNYPNESIPAMGDDNFCSRYLEGKKMTLVSIREVLPKVKIPEEVEPSTDDGDSSIGSVRRGDREMVKDDKLKLSLLYLLSSILFFSGNENARIDFSLIQIVENLEYAKTYPWGRRSYGFLIEQLTSLDMAQKKLSRNPQFKCPGFIIPLMLLPFELMSALSPDIGQLRENVNPKLPRMCKWTTKPKVKKQFPSFEQLLKLLVRTKDISSLIYPTPEERASRDMSFRPYNAITSVGDPTIDEWTTILEKEGHILFEDMYRADVAGKCSTLGLNSVEDVEHQPENDPVASSPTRPESRPPFSSIPHPEDAPRHSTEPNNEVARILGELVGKLIDMDSKVDVGLCTIKNELSKVDNRLSKVENSLSNVENRLSMVENRLTNVETHLAIFPSSKRDDEPVFDSVAPDGPVDDSAFSERNTDMFAKADEAVVAEGEVANVLMDMKHEDILPLAVDREHPKRERKKGRLIVSPYTELALKKKATKFVVNPEGQLEDINVVMDATPLSSFHEQTEKRKMIVENEVIGLKKVKVEDGVGIGEINYFEDITTRDKTRISNAMANRLPAEKVLVSLNNMDIKVGSLRTLKPNQWLDDEVVNFYLMLLNERQSREPERYLDCYYFSTFFFVQLKNTDYNKVRSWVPSVSLLENDALFVPIFDSMHWALAIINLKEQKFQYLDSLGPHKKDNGVFAVLKDYFVQYVNDTSGEVFDFTDWVDEVVATIPRQDNGDDCGVYMLKNVDYFCTREQFRHLKNYNPRHMKYFRQKIALEILDRRAV